LFFVDGDEIVEKNVTWEKMMRRPIHIFALFIIILVGCVPGGVERPAANSATAEPGTLYVDPGRELGAISPYIFGSNYGPFTAVPAGKMEEALQSHVTALRFPGGEWGDANNLSAWQLDGFVSLCQKMGAIPTISVRLLGGTPAAAAELVRYANIEKGYKILYWSIGNEPDLFEGRPNVDYDTVRFNREWRAIAVAMKAVDPTIRLMGPELSGSYTSDFAKNPKDTSRRDWMTEFLQANGDLTDIVTYHRYPFPLHSYSGGYTIADLRQDPPEWNKTVQYLRGLVKKTTGRDLPIGITEASSDSSKAIQGEATPDSFFHAIWWADVLGRAIDEKVFMVNQWMLANSSGLPGGWGLLSSGGVRPTYYVYQMYNHFGTERVSAASGIKDVSVYAAKRADGTLTLMVVNLADSKQLVPLVMHGKKLSKAEVWLFDAGHKAERLGERGFPADGRLELPAQSITLYVVGK
jgi:hypothetical protein